ncbi:HD-GYP domain-containing protein [Priestia koreensis]|uniref:HD-GYP domain-containing protein n=1 Tax=Priestia koreensis TaxID=284581 RepID=UPI001F570BBB|nr:HD domain-containing phosphohydrolase [Priestia koreensis]
MNLFSSFQKRMLRNYVFSSAFAVFGVGSTLIFHTLSLSQREIYFLLAIIMISVCTMLIAEFWTYNRQVSPIRLVYRSDILSKESLYKAHARLHAFPLLTLKRILGPHFLGIGIPSSGLAILCIHYDILSIPYYFIGLAWIGAFLIAVMHGLIEFFLTFETIKPLLHDIQEKWFEQTNEDLAHEKSFFFSIKKKMVISSLFFAIFPVVLFSLATQIRMQSIQENGLGDYWSWALIILVMVVIIALSGSFLLFKHFKQPIEQLQKGVYEVGQGSLNRMENVYSDEFSDLVTGYNHMIKAIRVRDELNQQLMESFFTAIAATLDARDPYTAGHSERVAAYSVQIGERAGFSGRELDLLKKSALLHDIGKIGVRDEVLLKEGRLTDEEFKQIKAHPVIGAHILSQVIMTEEIKQLLPGVKYHHERYDGKGYPEGLSGDTIPVFGRLIAVADAYDAMTSDRPYRKGMPAGKALQIIESGKGTQWDPHYATLFVDLMNEGFAKKVSGE